MAKPSIAITESFASEAKIADDIPREDVIRVLKFLRGVGISDPVPDEFDAKDTYSDIILDLLKPLHISPGHVICLVSVKPAVTEEVIVDASVVRSGRNLSGIALEWKLKKTGRLVYTARATFYRTPVAKL